MGGPKRTYGPNDWLTAGEAASVLNLAERTLRRWRAKGEGPPYFVHDRTIRYRYDRLLQWCEARHHRPAPAPPNRSGG